MNCPYCDQPNRIKYGSRRLKDGTTVQRYLCKNCQKRSNERTGSPMAKLRTPVQVVSQALKMRTEGLGIRATARVLDKSHSTVSCWEQRVADKEKHWSAEAKAGGDITVEGDELYTRVGQNLSPL